MRPSRTSQDVISFGHLPPVNQDLAIDVLEDQDGLGEDGADEDAAVTVQPASRKNSVVYTPGQRCRSDMLHMYLALPGMRFDFCSHCYLTPQHKPLHKDSSRQNPLACFGHIIRKSAQHSSTCSGVLAQGIRTMNGLKAEVHVSICLASDIMCSLTNLCGCTQSQLSQPQTASRASHSRLAASTQCG